MRAGNGKQLIILEWPGSEQPSPVQAYNLLRVLALPKRDCYWGGLGVQGWVPSQWPMGAWGYAGSVYPAIKLCPSM